MAYVAVVIIVVLVVALQVGRKKREDAYFALLGRGEGPQAILRSFSGHQKAAEALINRYLAAGYKLESIDGRRQMFSGSNLAVSTMFGFPGLGLLAGATTRQRKYELLFVRVTTSSPLTEIEE